MSFNSAEFGLFFLVVFILYWLVSKKSLRIQNVLLLVSSYVFYGWWDWRFLSLIFISSIVDYTVGLSLSRSQKPKTRKILLLSSLIINLGLLGFFKYFNFFVDSFVDLFSQFGLTLNPLPLNIILPVGISFYTFQSLSYTIDIYRNKISPTRDIVSFFAFVSFFPQLVAGPIERARNLLPQFGKERIFKYEKAIDGLRLILWGLFKKIVIADTCGMGVDYIFADHAAFGGGTLIIGAILFAFQIYGDFSGYSDIAIGTARLLGFNIMRNFALPYFSRDIAEFWRRWHISLSSWFRDYLYIPLGGRYVSRLKRIRNILITFVVSGLWHGANWTFVLWGLLHGLYYIPLMLLKKEKDHKDIVAKGRVIPSIKEIVQITMTFCIVVLAWVFFRAETVGQAFEYLAAVFSSNPVNFSGISFTGLAAGSIPIALLLIFVLLVVEWFQKEKEHALEVTRLPIIVRWTIYTVLVVLTLTFFGATKTFIYFQF